MGFVFLRRCLLLGGAVPSAAAVAVAHQLRPWSAERAARAARVLQGGGALAPRNGGVKFVGVPLLAS